MMQFIKYFQSYEALQKELIVEVYFTYIEHVFFFTLRVEPSIQYTPECNENLRKLKTNLKFSIFFETYTNLLFSSLQPKIVLYD